MNRLLCVLVAAVVVLGAVGADFDEENITVYNREACISLGGTLTSPSDGNVKGLLVLATGSGQQNRDEEIMGHRPFKVIAEYLSANGYAVLRMDDRGVGESGGDPSVSTTDDYVGDLSAALVKMDSCFAGVPAGVLGHSEGGMAAVKLANVNPRCDFIVTLGAPAWAGDSIIMSQGRAISRAMTGRWDGEALQRYFLDLVKSDMPDMVIRPMIYMKMAEQLGDAARVPEVQAKLHAQCNVLCSPWYRAFIRYNPVEDIRNVKVPWLAMNGDKDLQVLPDNLETVKDLNPAVETLLLKGHNHLFQRCATGLMQEYASIPEDISAEALTSILEWLDRTVGQILPSQASRR